VHPHHPPASHQETEAGLRVVATAGHVDHGKSALILALTGTDPDRLAEEKRRGLTIDLGFAWTTLPSGREVGFVDVPGHERFIRNMLAGVGPVRLILFVVSADEGWKPQSEEHLQIVDVLGAHGGVVVLTKSDLVDVVALDARVEEVGSRLRGTRLEGAAIVPCSSVTGQGMDAVLDALDGMLASAPPVGRDGRPRHFIDRVFTIRGAGTVVTGTLAGGPLSVGLEAEILPTGHRARIRGLQTHKRSLETAWPVSRVAVNLAGTPKEELERGDVLTLPGRWRATSRFEGWVRTVRGLEHPLTARGAYKLYAGSAERDARIRLYGATEIRPGDEAFVRVAVSRPVVLDFHDGFVLREAGRQETVAGGLVLDVDPPLRPSQDRAARLRPRVEGAREPFALEVVQDRGVIRTADLMPVTGLHPDEVVRAGAIRVGDWLLAAEVTGPLGDALIDRVSDHHHRHPLRPGLEVGEARLALAAALPAFSDPDLADAFVQHLEAAGGLVREGTTLRLPDHAVTTEGREDAGRLIDAVREGEPTPPSVQDLVTGGYGLELIRATCQDGRLVRVSPDIVVTPDFLAKAKEIVRANGTPPGITVSRFREALGTSRKYALPILEYFDARGITRRQGDVRIARS
jgi:selenocysteine-specific elongation factor